MSAEKDKRPVWVAPKSRAYYLDNKTSSMRREDFVAGETKDGRIVMSRSEVREQKREKKRRKGREARARRRWEKAMQEAHSF